MRCADRHEKQENVGSKFPNGNHSLTPSASATVKMSLSPRPEQLTMMILSRSDEHTSELQSLMRISYAVFCLKKKTKQQQHTYAQQNDAHNTSIISSYDLP